MKVKLLAILGILFSACLLSACATLSPKSMPSNSVNQMLSEDEQTQLSQQLNTAQDGKPTLWHNAEGNAAFMLTTAHTYVNEQGLPCRHYTLVIDRDYSRKVMTSGVVCRDEGEWGKA